MEDKKFTRELIIDNTGIVLGDDMRDLLKVLPELESQFKQRHDFDEFYFESKLIEIKNLNVLEELINQGFIISEINKLELKIKV